jgi:hypothetical protein
LSKRADSTFIALGAALSWRLTSYLPHAGLQQHCGGRVDLLNRAVSHFASASTTFGTAIIQNAGATMATTNGIYPTCDE